MKWSYRHGLLAAALLLGLSSTALAVDLEDPYAKLIREGRSAYFAGDYETASKRFADARVVKPEGIEAVMNLALARARQEKHEEAQELFQRVIDESAENEQLRAAAEYNLGRSQFDAAKALYGQEKPDREGALKGAIESLKSFNEAIGSQNNFAEAEHNRAQVQHFLQQLAQEMPPPQQQQQQQDQENKDQEKQDKQDQQQQQQNNQQQDQDQNKDQQQQQQQPKDQQQKQDKPQEGQNDQKQDQNKPQSKGDQQQKPPDQQQDQQNQSPTDGDQQQEKKDQQEQKEQDQKPEEQKKDEQKQQANEGGDQKKDQSEGTPEGEAPQQPQGEGHEMTPEEARQMLNLLGDKDPILLKQGRLRSQAPPEKDW